MYSKLSKNISKIQGKLANNHRNAMATSGEENFKIWCDRLQEVFSSKPVYEIINF